MKKENYDLYREELKRILEYNNTYITDEELGGFTDFLNERWKYDNLKLYRYSTDEYYNIRNFETGKLKLTNTGVLNDVYEGIPVDCDVSLDRNLIEQLKDVAQIKSFSETPEDVKMWGYYAKDHTGFCVEYDVSELESDDKIINHIYPVVYSEKRSYITDVKKMIDELKQLRIDIKERYCHDYDGYLNDITSLFVVKGKQWEYEREWRIIFTLLQIYEEDEEELYNGIINFDCATGIYLGYRIDSEIEKNIIEIVQRINVNRVNKGRTTISVYKMKLAPDSYELVYEEIPVKN